MADRSVPMTESFSAPSAPARIGSVMLGPESLLAGLDEQQRLAAQTLLGPVCVLAGAGTGKTRTITHRIAYGVATGAYTSSKVMALTFTSRAAAELRGRLRHLGAGGVAARTFHAAALAQLGFFWPQVVGGSLPRILGAKGRLIAQAAQTLKLKLDTPALRDLAAEIEWRKVSCLTLDQYAALALERILPAGLDVEKVVAVQRAYESVKDDRKQIDFEDVLLAMAGMMELEPRVAHQVREQYRFFVVDEYQDVSPLQQHLLGLWLGERNDLCVVGDASQTIYSFAGASAQYLLTFATRYRQAKVFRLESNYRSEAGIIATANRLMRGRPGALTLQAATRAAGAGASGDAADAAGRAAETVVIACASDGSEARSVAAQIADRIAAGTKPEDIAVLFRVNAQSAAVEAALQDLGIGFQLHGGTRFFELQEVKQALMLLKGATVVPSSEPLFKTVSDVLRSLGWTQDPPQVGGAVRDRWESLNTVMTLAEAAPLGTTLRGFVDELHERAAGQHEPPRSAVTLATLHSVKGLEWGIVYLIGLSEGLMPISYARSEQAIEEERRLLYVGITRARESLQLSWAASGSHRGADRRPSRFLAELDTRTRDEGSTAAG